LVISVKIFRVLILIALIPNFSYVAGGVLAESPRFDRYEETDVQSDLRLMGVVRDDGDVQNDVLDRLMGVDNTRLDNSSDCAILNYILEQDSYPTFLPDISALNIFSDGKYLNYTAWFYTGFQNRLVVTNESSTSRHPLMSIDIISLENNKSSLGKYVDNIIIKLKENALDFRLVERENILISDHHAAKIVYNTTNFVTSLDSQFTKYILIDSGNVFVITQYIPSEKYSKSIKDIVNSFQTGSTRKNESSNSESRLYDFLTGSTRNNGSSNHSYDVNAKYYKDDLNNFSLYLPTGWTISEANPLLGPGDKHIFPPVEKIEEIGRQYQLTIDILQKNNEGGDFVERILWDFDTGSWTHLITERPGSYEGSMRIIDEQINFSNFYHNRTYSKVVDDLLELRAPRYISSSVDLQSLGYPSKYGVVFSVITIYKLGDNLCQVFDVIGPIPLPPPFFFISMNPRNLDLFPGEDENIELNFTTTTPWDWSISFNSNPTDEFETEFGLKETQLVSDSELTTKINLKALPNATSDMHLIPITASAQLKGINLTLPSDIRGYPKDLSRTYNETEYLKVIVPESPSIAENFNNFVDEWITPMSGVWALSAGVAAVLAPLVIKIYKRSKKRKP
jgi:hypothetical protein